MLRINLFVFIAAAMLTINTFGQNISTEQAFEKGTREARAGNHQTALESYQTALLSATTEPVAADDFQAKIHYNIGVCLFQLKRTDDAVEEFTEAVKLSRRKYQKAFYALGMAESELRNWEKAENAFQQAVKLKKDDGEAQFDLAMVLLAKKDFDAARTAFQNAVNYGSVNIADALNNVGVILALKGDFPAAERKFEAALRESDGKSREAENNLRFCKFYKQSFTQNQIAQLEFSQAR